MSSRFKRIQKLSFPLIERQHQIVPKYFEMPLVTWSWLNYSELPGMPNLTELDLSNCDGRVFEFVATINAATKCCPRIRSLALPVLIKEDINGGPRHIEQCLGTIAGKV